MARIFIISILSSAVLVLTNIQEIVMIMLLIRTKSHQLLLIFLFFILLVPMSNALESSKANVLFAKGLSVSIGLEYESGDYGTTDTTDTWRIPFGMHYRTEQFFAGLNVPYINTKSSGNIIISSGTSRKKVTTSSSTSSKESGIGDLEFYAGYIFPAKTGSMANYNVTARVKLATAGENKGLGTGENDYAIEIGFLNYLYKSSVFGSIGYQLNGDTVKANYDDIFYANAGISFPLQSGNKVGAMLDYSQAASSGFDDALGLTGFINLALTNKRSLYIYAMQGLSDGSADYALGANFRFGF